MVIAAAHNKRLKQRKVFFNFYLTVNVECDIFYVSLRLGALFKGNDLTVNVQ